MAEPSTKDSQKPGPKVPKLVEDPSAAAEELLKYTRGRLEDTLHYVNIKAASARNAQQKLAKAQAAVTRTAAAHALAVATHETQTALAAQIEGLVGDPQRMVIEHIALNFNRDLAVAIKEFCAAQGGEGIMNWHMAGAYLVTACLKPGLADASLLEKVRSTLNKYFYRLNCAEPHDTNMSYGHARVLVGHARKMGFLVDSIDSYLANPLLKILIESSDHI